MHRLLIPLLLAAASHAAEFPTPYNTEQGEGSPMPAEQAAKEMKMPAGFRCQVFAAEPDVQNPIAMAWDHKGRMWVAENYTYAERSKRFDLALRDRVIILEDKDNDGKAESRKVSTDEVQMLTSVEVGHGGVWLFAPPQILFIAEQTKTMCPMRHPRSCSMASPSQRQTPQLRQRPSLGARWLALRTLRSLLPREDRRSGHARRRARADEGRHLPFQSEDEGRGGAHAWHHESLGPRLG